MTASKPTIIVTGSNGQLGSELKALHDDSQYNWVFATRETLDLADAASIEALMTQYHPKWFVNCAAYTAVDKAESEQEAAIAANATAPGLIAAACHKIGAGLIHISTDYVFNGAGTAPYQPDDATSPVNYYGVTKLQGEENALQNNDHTIIIRTSWVYSSFGKNFVKTMRSLMQGRPELNVVADQYGAPTYARDLAAAIITIVNTAQPVWGIYHFSNQGEITWHDFAVAIKELSGLDSQVNPIPTSGFPTPAKRPAYSVMDISKIQNTYHIRARYWIDSLKECIALLEQQK